MLRMRIFGVCILLCVWDQSRGFPSTHRYCSSFNYLFIHLFATCFGRTTIFKQKYNYQEITLLTTDPLMLRMKTAKTLEQAEFFRLKKSLFSTFSSWKWSQGIGGGGGPWRGKVLKLDNTYKIFIECPKVNFSVPEKNRFIRKCQPLIRRTVSTYKPKDLTRSVILLKGVRCCRRHWTLWSYRNFSHLLHVNAVSTSNLLRLVHLCNSVEGNMCYLSIRGELLFSSTIKT
jgi:hypothetical protein